VAFEGGELGIGNGETGSGTGKGEMRTGNPAIVVWGMEQQSPSR